MTKKPNENPMDTFLKSVAKDMYEKLGDNLARTAVVFPNKRAGLFFNQWLARLSDKPVWTPTYLTISDLFRSLSDTTVGDSIGLVCSLHEVFCKETGSDETLDSFFFWGEMLLSDFDDLDKNMVDADRLFANLSDLRKFIDDHSYLTEEQVEALQLFFQNFSMEKETELKQRFATLWDSLGSIYHAFRDSLRRRGLAYEGMLYREVVEQLNPDMLPYEHYVFVGFNVLNQVETTLFSRLQRAGKALFYWDYDEHYLLNSRHEAGEFIRRNLKMFPNELTERELFRNLTHSKVVHYVAAPTESAQAHYLTDWLRRNVTPLEHETAVVLCNEALLQPVLHALPDESIRALNVTMGFPLSQTPVYSFTNLLLELQSTGRDKRRGNYYIQPVMAMLKHPYMRKLSSEALKLERDILSRNRFFPSVGELQRDEQLALVFTEEQQGEPVALCQYLLRALQALAAFFRSEPEHDKVYAQLYQEALFKTYTTLNRFCDLLATGQLEIQTQTFCRLLRNVLSSLSIPFHGEPVTGLQVMGVLETRCLDFRHLVMLSVNEGNLPKGEGDSSFIPYNLRKAFGMTTVEHKNAVYAYYFYRLMQRAERVTLLYNTSSDGLNRGEMSRFLLQFLIESGQDVKRESLQAEQGIVRQPAIVVEKNPDIIARMVKRFGSDDTLLSPSALNTYLNCPLRFYLQYVGRLKEPDEVSEDIDNSVFGNIFHRACEWIYKERLSGRDGLVRRSDIEELLKDEWMVYNYVDRAFKELFFKIPQEQRSEYNGLQLLNSEVLVTYVKQLLRYDAAHAPFRFAEAEYTVKKTVKVQSGGVSHTLNLGGNIDRIDEQGDTIRIIDYKTGSRPHEAKEIEELFDPKADKRGYHIFQIFFYASLMCEERKCPVSPLLFYVQKAASPEYSPVVQLGTKENSLLIDDFNPLKAEFDRRLSELLQEIFNPEVPFTQTPVQKHCEYCSFAVLCGRAKKGKE